MTLDELLADLSSALSDLRGKGLIQGFALIGGMAVSTWAVARATKDVDFAILVKRKGDAPLIMALDPIAQYFKDKGYHSEIRRGEIGDPVAFLLKVSKERGLPADIIVAMSAVEKEAVLHAQEIDWGGQKVPVATPDYLIILKLLAGGPQDIVDASQLLRLGNISKELVRRLADEAGVKNQLERAEAL